MELMGRQRDQINPGVRRSAHISPLSNGRTSVSWRRGSRHAETERWRVGEGERDRERGIENERKEEGVREKEGEGGMERTTEREGDREEGRESWSGPGECTSSRQKINSLHLSPSS